MRGQVMWTAELDRRLMALRWERRTWDAIAAEMGIGRYSVVERGRRLGARRAPPARPECEDRDRPPRPAGHPESWGLLTAGGVLDGVPYPYPVFL